MNNLELQQGRDRGQGGIGAGGPGGVVVSTPPMYDQLKPPRRRFLVSFVFCSFFLSVFLPLPLSSSFVILSCFRESPGVRK